MAGVLIPATISIVTAEATNVLLKIQQYRLQRAIVKEKEKELAVQIGINTVALN